MERRAFKILMAVLLVGALCLVARLATMQLLQGEEYRQRAQRNMLQSRPLLPPRGKILDRQGRTLAHNEPIFIIHFLPYRYARPQVVLERLADILHLNPQRRRQLRERLEESPQEDIVLTESMSQIALARFAEIDDASEGLRLEVKARRVYPGGSLASHVLGYVGEIDREELAKPQYNRYLPGEWVGQDGVEKSHENLLHGKQGIVEEALDLSGLTLSQRQILAAQPGADLYLSLDLELQKAAEASLGVTLQRLARKNGERSGGAIVALEPTTGRVRALVSLPNYNPNHFAAGITQRQFDSLLRDPCVPLLNRAVHGAYPPGSTFKLVTTSAALNEGLINSHSTFYCSGQYMVAGLPFNCFVRFGHGRLNLIEVLGHSCDVVYYQLGTKLGIGRLERYSHLFGLGEKSGIDLPGETAGNIPNPQWKEKNFRESWYPGDAANSAIGQGFVATSPLQVALMTGAVVTDGYLYRPQLLEAYTRRSGGRRERVNNPPQLIRKLPWPSSYFRIVREGMRLAVAEGTAAASGGAELGMAGKTGTAENAPTVDNPRGLNHCWFTGYAPYGASAKWQGPPLVVTVFLEKSGGYGGELAAPIAAQVLKKWRSLQASRLKK